MKNLKVQENKERKNVELSDGTNFSAEYYFNDRFNKYQLSIDMIDLELVDEMKRFSTIEEMKSFLQTNYNYTF